MLFYPFDICLVISILCPHTGFKNKKYIAYACLVFAAVFIDACVMRRSGNSMHIWVPSCFPKPLF
jgi:hypothetical protein